MRPRLVRKVPIKVQYLAESQNIDPDFNQIVDGPDYETDNEDNPVYNTLYGQPVFQNKDEAGMSQAGATRQSTGYIIMTKKEAEKLDKFDKIVAINNIDLEAPVFVLEKRPNSFGRGGSNLIKVLFTDRTDING